MENPATWGLMEQAINHALRQIDAVEALPANERPIGLSRARRIADAIREVQACEFCAETEGQPAPRHFASERCESGRRNHCSCDVCF